MKVIRLNQLQDGMTAVMALIQAVLMVFQAATATPVVSATLETTATGGLLQSPVPTRGIVYCSMATTLSAEKAASVVTTAFLLVASRIKNSITHQLFKLFFHHICVIRGGGMGVKKFENAF